MRKTTTPLRNLRRSRTISQANLAHLVDVSQQTLSKYESGRLVPSFDMKVRIAAVLGAPVNDIFPSQEAVAS